MKAGFSSLYDAQTTKHAISEARCTLRAKLELAVQETTISSTGGEFFENAVVALEEACEGG